jgi:hypothetical protein
VIAGCPTRETAHHGGDTKPAAAQIKEKMSNLEDVYDEQEPEPDMHFFDAKTNPKNNEASNDHEHSSILLDTPLNPC